MPARSGTTSARTHDWGITKCPDASQPIRLRWVIRVAFAPARHRPLDLSYRKMSTPLRTGAVVESRMGAVAWGRWPAPRFPSPLIEPDVRISRIRLSDWLHPKAHDGRPLDAGVRR